MTFITFDSWDEMQDYLASARILADAFTEDWQRAVKPGDYFLTTAPEMDDLIIYNHVQEDPEGPYVFVRAYSVVVPEGEYGSVPLPNIRRMLTPEQWERAKALDWPDTPEGLAEVLK